MHRPIQSSKTMGVSIKQLYGTKTLEEKEKEEEFWREWYLSQHPTVYSDSGRLEDLSLSIDEAIQLFIGDEVTTKDIPKLRKIVLEDDSLTDEDKAFITGLIQAVEADALQATDGGKPVEVPTASPEEATAMIQALQARITELEALTASPTASPEKEQPAPSELQALQKRITELEDENEELRANQRQKKQGKQQRGTLGLKACQRIGAFAILLELLTGKEVGVFQADGTQNKPLKTLYSEVTNTGIDTTTADISRLQNRDHQIKEHTREKIRTELISLLQAMGIAFGE